MDREEAIAYIVEKQAKMHDRNDIVTTVCEQMGIDWSEAEALVHEAEERYGHQVAVRQSPFFLGMAVAAIVGGVGLITFGLTSFESMVEVNSIWQLFDLQMNFAIGASILAGLAMIAGGAIGLGRVLTEIFHQEDQ